ncbi:MAG: hypothetical protein JNK81_04970 [Anaerolineales bacterium]|nr:hypothetical protein [Anaerolineales bacterium]
MIKKYVSFSLVCASIIFILTSCSQVESVRSIKRKMNYPLADYTSLGWISKTELAAFVPKEKYGSVIGYYLEDDKHFYQLNLPLSVPELDCKGVDDIGYTQPYILPNGLLGLINGCTSRPVSLDPTIKRDYMVAYDFQTQKVEFLVKQPLPNYLSNGYTWSPDMKLGLMQIYGGLNGTIYWMS